MAFSLRYARTFTESSHATAAQSFLAIDLGDIVLPNTEAYQTRTRVHNLELYHCQNVSGRYMVCSKNTLTSFHTHQQYQRQMDGYVLNADASFNDASLCNEYGWQVEDQETGYRILEQPCGTRRVIRIIFIGAGASGICFSKMQEDRLRNVELQVYEKNHDIGGTWLENRYPGCACDIPSACYQFSWERNPNWSKYYSESPEIWQYLKDVAIKYKLERYVKVQHEVRGCYWDHDSGQWDIHVYDAKEKRTFIDHCHVLVNGNGVLNNWEWPNIEGLHDFQGELYHTACYDEGVDLSRKRVAVVGTGSSGIQIISKIADDVERLYTWIRTPTWVTSGFAQRFAGEGNVNFEYTAQQKKYFTEHPDMFLKYSKMIESELNGRFRFILRNTAEAQDAAQFATAEMTKRLGGNKQLVDAIVPKHFGVGCRRPTPGGGFLEALTQDNVHVFTNGSIRKVTKTGFISADGSAYEVDVIICATGFNTSWVPKYPVIGLNDKNVAEMWKEQPVPSYLSISVPHIPNYFLMGGPYGPLGHGSFLPILETLADNIISCIRKIQQDRIKYLTPYESVARQFTNHADLFLKRTAWSEDCSSWFKQGRVNGPLAIFPGSRLVFLRLLSEPRFEDYDIVYLNDKNRFEFLGNGFDAREFDGRDLSYYLGMLPEIGDKQIDLEADLSDQMDMLVPDSNSSHAKMPKLIPDTQGI